MKDLNGKPLTDLEGNILTKVLAKDIERDKAVLKDYADIVVDGSIDIKEEILKKLKEMGGDSSQGETYE